MARRANLSLMTVAVVGLLSMWGSASSSESIQGLISQWKFDEGEGSIAYDSAGNNDGTIYGAQWTTGQVDGALQFDGHDDYVEVGDKLNDVDLPFSIIAWVKINQNGEYCVFASDDAPSGNYHGFWLRIPKKFDEYSLNVNYGDGSSAGSSGRRSKNSHVPIQSNTWTFIGAVVRGATNMGLYINGQDVGGAYSGSGGAMVHNSNRAVIGVFSRYGPDYFNGRIDEVAVYNRALSAEEIEELYLSAFPSLVGLEIVGPGEVAEDFRASYKAIAYYDNNTTRDVTDLAVWSVEPNTAANIDENGLLTTQDIVKHRSAIILASYTEGDVTFNAEKVVNIFPTCPTGTALQFDGMDDFVQAPTTGLPTGNSDRTLQLWVKLNVIPLGHEAYFAGYGNFGSLKQVYVLGSSGAMVFFSQWGDGVGGPSLAPGQWYHVAVTNVGNLATLYLDGTVVGSKSMSIETPAGTKFYIGRIAGSLGDFRRLNGLVDEVAIFSRALSAEEIRGNMHTRLAGDEPGLVGYWDFDEGEGQIVYDLSGNGNDGQLGVTADVDASDPTWVDSDVPIGICTPYLIATMAAEHALERKTALIEELLTMLAQELAAYEVLEELLESGDYDDLNKGAIVKAKQKIHSATKHEEQSIDALEKSIEKLEDALAVLGIEVEPTLGW